MELLAGRCRRCQGQIEPIYFRLILFLPLVCSTWPKVRPVASAFSHYSAHTRRLPSRARHSPFRACWFGLRAEPWRFQSKPAVDGLELSLSPVSTPVWLTGCASRRPDLYVFEPRGAYQQVGAGCGRPTWPAFPPTPILSPGRHRTGSRRFRRSGTAQRRRTADPLQSPGTSTDQRRRLRR